MNMLVMLWMVVLALIVGVVFMFWKLIKFRFVIEHILELNAADLETLRIALKARRGG